MPTKIGNAEQPCDIVIAGGGVAGLALALALKQAAGSALSVRLHDPALERAKASGGKASGGPARAYAIAAGARRMLGTIGIWDAIEPHAQALTAMDITDSALEEPIRPLFLSFDGELAPGEPFAHMVEERPLLAALTAAARAQGAVFSTEPVTGFEAAPGEIAVTAANGDRFRARLLVAADGARSKLRALAGIPFHGWSYDQAAIVGAIRHERDHGGRAVEHFLPSGPFALLPLKGNRSSIVWTERKSEAAAIIARDAGTLAAMIERRFGLELGSITLEGPLQTLPLSLGLAGSFIGQRLALLGDAAHVIHPIAGQGLNLGLKDAAALAEVIVDQLRLGLDPGSPEALAAYQRSRRFDTAQMAVTTDVLNRLFSNDIAPLRTLREVGLGLVERLPGLKTFFIGQAAGTGARMPRLMRGDSL
ncbi:MAG: ubiquinone biosynthesis hydroxylase [Methylocystis sp.]|nr:ubiquinone biosynthesis hydroxylase [Methylocystis sp.]MCA3583243.1 ubiquinone biosynthesis hydroxylase [Methylocystis sp.]MCA3587552.1 ubiquinone biosynthesis hydroxylase [Methylocystis sp.]MCA3590679.1 ubiquinone biosynthesis hydroxylase [Methylocystis sp.]